MKGVGAVWIDVVPGAVVDAHLSLDRKKATRGTVVCFARKRDDVGVRVAAACASVNYAIIEDLIARGVGEGIRIVLSYDDCLLQRASNTGNDFSQGDGLSSQGYDTGQGRRLQIAKSVHCSLTAMMIGFFAVAR